MWGYFIRIYSIKEVTSYKRGNMTIQSIILVRRPMLECNLFQKKEVTSGYIRLQASPGQKNAVG
jgi:hypothetical protein